MTHYLQLVPQTALNNILDTPVPIETSVEVKADKDQEELVVEVGLVNPYMWIVALSDVILVRVRLRVLVDSEEVNVSSGE